MDTEADASTVVQKDDADVKQESDGGEDKKDDKSKCDEPSTGTNGSFECNICLDQAQDAVVSKCGHLFCWPCLHQWLETRPNSPICPVCKAAISKDSVIPLYGRGGNHKEDPRLKAPPRPQGQRTEPQQPNRSSFAGFTSIFNQQPGGARFGNNNFQMSVGVGAFPFGLFSTSFNIGGQNVDENGEASSNDVAATVEAENLSKFFLGMAIFFIAWLLVT